MSDDKLRTYYGYVIERSFPSGYWVTLAKGKYAGYLKADTLTGLRAIIRDDMGKEDSN